MTKYTMLEQLRWLSHGEGGAYLGKVAGRLEDMTRALEWYEERCRQFADTSRSINYLEAVSTELILDGGTRARLALEPSQAPTQEATDP